MEAYIQISVTGALKKYQNIFLPVVSKTSKKFICIQNSSKHLVLKS